MCVCDVAAARARERALAAHRKDEEDEEEDEGSTLVSEETNPMLDGANAATAIFRAPTPELTSCLYSIDRGREQSHLPWL